MANTKTHKIDGQLRFWSLLLASVFLGSCVPIEKMIYLQEESETHEELLEYNKVELKLQVNDILDIQISSMNPEVNALFENVSKSSVQAAQATAQTGGDLFYLTGFSINDKGQVDIPFVGPVYVLGLTLSEAHAVIDSAVNKLFTNYHLQVKLGGVRFSAIGEFQRPGKRVVMQNQVTLFEAIALCGDLTNVADRKAVKLVRQYPGGSKVHVISLLDRDIIKSPFYFIQPNDVIYAEPLPQRSWGIGVTGAQTLSTIIGTLSTSLALALSIISLNR